MLSIGFDFVCDEAPIFGSIARRLASDGQFISGLTMGRRWATYWQDFETVSVGGDNDWSISKVESELVRIEKIYGPYLTSSLPARDRFIRKLPRDKQRRILAQSFDAVERYFDKYTPDIYFSSGIAYLYHMVTYAVASTRGIPHISISSPPSALPAFIYSVTARKDYRVADRLFEPKHTIETAHEVPLQQVEISKAADAAAPHYEKYNKKSFGRAQLQLRELILRLKSWYLDGVGRRTDDYITQHPIWYVARDIRKYLRLIQLQLHPKLFDRCIDYDQPFSLFALQVQPEASTIIHAHWHDDQTRTIENISKSIPADLLLYVKEHPSAFGNNSLRFYNKIKALHNVRLINPRIPVCSLLEKSTCIISFGGTIGWEALQLGKPSFTLGDGFYNRISGDIFCDSYEMLAQQLRRFRNSSNYSQADVERYSKCLKEGLLPGVFAPCSLAYRDMILSEDNINLVLAGIKRIIEMELPVMRR
ncbi:hypothetical protein L2D00_06580 [Hyphomonadaceae bacterium BL14]|nr:hypothetical protein L2D00_06580 [Hyphomonadaceae bacterium BL14]